MFRGPLSSSRIPHKGFFFRILGILGIFRAVSLASVGMFREAFLFICGILVMVYQRGIFW